jgi:hypothetical protein
VSVINRTERRRIVVKRTVIGVALALGMVSGASAQPTQSSAEAEQTRARQRVFMMEGVLERAVQIGVDSLRQRVRTVMPDDTLLLSGAPAVRGFRLEGYGVIFDVEVPALRRSMAWSLRTMNESAALVARDLAQMRAIAQSIPDQRARAEFDRSLRRVQQQIGPVPPPMPETAAAQAVAAQAVSTPAVPTGPTAQAVSATAVIPGALAGGLPPEPLPPAPLPDAQLLQDPSEAYTQEVKSALVDAMVENSGPLGIGPDEWLTIAARDNVQIDRFTPGDPSEVSTIILRIKGSDLAAYRAGRITLDQVRQRVEVRDF